MLGGAAGSVEPPVPKGGFFALIKPGDLRGEILRELYRAGALERDELPERLQFSKSRVKSALGELHRYGLVRSRPIGPERRSGARDRRSRPVERRGEQPDGRRRREGLTQSGVEFAQFAIETEALERRLRKEPRAPAKLRSLLEMIGHHVRRLVIDALLDGAAPFMELFGRVRREMPELAKSTFADHLKALTEGGMVEKEPAAGPGGQDRYRLAPIVPALARVILLSARFRLAATPSSAPWMAGNLVRLVKLLALPGELRAPPSLHGVVRVHVLPVPHLEQGWDDVYLCLDGGRIALGESAVARSDAIVLAAPLALCDALLRGGVEGLEIDGARDLADAALAALADAVPPPAAP
jgi:DNA-binding HxlR family transcriptional regulator